MKTFVVYLLQKLFVTIMFPNAVNPEMYLIFKLMLFRKVFPETDSV